MLPVGIVEIAPSQPLPLVLAAQAGLVDGGLLFSEIATSLGFRGEEGETENCLIDEELPDRRCGAWGETILPPSIGAANERAKETVEEIGAGPYLASAPPMPAPELNDAEGLIEENGNAASTAPPASVVKEEPERKVDGGMPKDGGGPPALGMTGIVTGIATEIVTEMTHRASRAISTRAGVSTNPGEQNQSPKRVAGLEGEETLSEPEALEEVAVDRAPAEIQLRKRMPTREVLPQSSFEVAAGADVIEEEGTASTAKDPPHSETRDASIAAEPPALAERPVMALELRAMAVEGPGIASERPVVATPEAARFPAAATAEHARTERMPLVSQVGAAAADRMIDKAASSGMRVVSIRLPIEDGSSLRGTVDISVSRRSDLLEVKLTGSSDNLQRAVSESLESLVQKLAVDRWMPEAAGAPRLSQLPNTPAAGRFAEDASTPEVRLGGLEMQGTGGDLSRERPGSHSKQEQSEQSSFSQDQQSPDGSSGRQREQEQQRRNRRPWAHAWQEFAFNDQSGKEE